MNRSLVIVVMSACLAACSGGASMSDSHPSAVSAASATTDNVDFTEFTKTLVASRPDTTDPVPVASNEFVFPDNDNPTAFAAVLTGT